jgi:NADH-quinone oxidoreductase subunit L
VINYAWLVPVLPLLGAVVAATSGHWLKQNSHVPVVAGIGAAFLVALALLFNVGDGVGTTAIYPWIDAGELFVPVEFRVDGLTTMMLVMVTFVATLVAIFAAGYMAGDPGYPRFFAEVGLFVFSMTGLVLSNNFVLTYAFWEGVGVCSYLLVGFWYKKPSAAAAAKKAFMVNRLGDFGFAIALFWIWSLVPNHDLSYNNVLAPSGLVLIPYDAQIGIGLLLFWAATAKSAQIPLYVWLPDAMEGPTPVSALIHAATMVTAGVYLIARSSPLIMNTQEVPLVIAIVGCATALLTALIALTQTDLKRVLAYSTVSQLGYMFMGLGAGIGGVMRLAVVAAMFHLFTHAFFKALLFLGSGSVMHAMGGVIDMRRFRGLRHRMPYTHGTFLVGVLALAGLPPLAAFFSKDEILSALKQAARAANDTNGPGWGIVYWAIYVLAVFTAFLTAFYTGRAYFSTFWGPEKLPNPDDPEAEPDEAHDHAPAAPAGHSEGVTHGPAPQHKEHGHDDHLGHESPPIMWVPLVVLAVCAVFVGAIFGPTGLFERHVIGRTPLLKGLGHLQHHGADYLTMVLGTLVGAAGLFLSWWMYADVSPLPARVAQRLKPLYEASRGKFFVDEIYGMLVVAPTLLTAKLSRFVDVYIVDGLVRLTAWIPRLVGRNVLGPFQNGLIQFYAATTALGVTLLLIVMLFWRG